MLTQREIQFRATKKVLRSKSKIFIDNISKIDCEEKNKTIKRAYIESKKSDCSNTLDDIELENKSPTKIKCTDDSCKTKNSESTIKPKPVILNLFRNVKEALHSSVPTNMACRDNEIKTLVDILQKSIKEKTSSSIYISGPPGTGKTATVTKILESPEYMNEFKKIFINCTSVKSSGSIYSNIVDSLKLKTKGKSAKECLSSIEKYLAGPHPMLLIILDEIDQLDSKKQVILYNLFEWPANPNNKIVLIGIANALDLTDRILPRLQTRVSLKPTLLHFAPYTKEQIEEILKNRLEEANISTVFSPVAIQILARKVSAVSGDIRRALDISRRAVELAEQMRKKQVLQSTENEQNNTKPLVDLKEIMTVLNNVYASSQQIDKNMEKAFPVQQKILLCSLLLILKKGRSKDVTVGKLYDVYKKICQKRNIFAVDQSEFAGILSLVESRGILKTVGKKDLRLQKVCLEWDEGEIGSIMQDKQLMASILEDTSCL